ncbi:MAG: hypothetical protein HQM09_05400 [Candidatus Riflebacteria bacterium]|nr:hypothetical protein [Candidatus Riflebacteria bacterium]
MSQYFPRSFTFLHGLLFRAAILAGTLVAFGCVSASAEKNLLPRLPEFVIERGFSDAFQVVESSVHAHLVDQTAESHVLVTLKNITATTVQSSVKIRILYLESENSAQLSVNGHTTRYDRKNPRIPFSLAPAEQITFEVRAKQGIEYNLDMIKKEQRNAAADEEGEKESHFALNDLTKLFDRENYGRRFLIGPLVSKWGIFPVDFKHLAIEIVVPRDFDGVFPKDGLWQKKEHSTSVSYIFEGMDGYTGAVFLPRQDVETFKKLRAEAAHSLSGSGTASMTTGMRAP